MAKAARSVSWAPGLKLCQVRLFLSEDAPVLSGLDAQDNLQAKSSRLWHSSTSGTDESPPPGFESFNQINQFKIDFSQIPLIQWKYPLRFDLNPNWLLVAGEESCEVNLQNRRQLGVLEAIYPRDSSIPPNSSVAPEALDSHYDDCHTALVPLTPIEDEEDSDTTDPVPQFDASISQNFPGPAVAPLKFDPSQAITSAAQYLSSSLGSQASASMPSVKPDVVAAATLAYTAILSSGRKDSLVDSELLIKLLNDPKLIETLASGRGVPVQGIVPLPPAAMPSPLPTPVPMICQSPQPHPVMHSHIGPPGRFHPTNFVTTNAPSPPIAPITEAPLGRDPNSISAARSSGARDITYYKSLIEQHGGEKQGTWDPIPPPQFSNRPSEEGERVMQGLKRDSKIRVAKPCAYFNTPRGCKNGTSCLFLHDTSVATAIDRRNPKRVKLDREIA